MKKIFASLFGENKKEDSRKEDNNEYTDFLINELENLKQESELASSAKETKIDELQKKLSIKEQELDSLKEKVAEYKEKNQKLTMENGETASLNTRLGEYEDSYKTFSALIQNAKKEAEQTILNAKHQAEQTITDADIEAEKIKREAKIKAEAFQKEAEAQINKKAEEHGKEYMLAKYKLMEYLNTLNKTQSKLIDIYNEFGGLVHKLPLRIEDIFSDEPFELLADQKKEFEKKGK